MVSNALSRAFKLLFSALSASKRSLTALLLMPPLGVEGARGLLDGRGGGGMGWVGLSTMGAAAAAEEDGDRRRGCATDEMRLRLGPLDDGLSPTDVVAETSDRTERESVTKTAMHSRRATKR